MTRLTGIQWGKLPDTKAGSFLWNKRRNPAFPV